MGIDGLGDRRGEGDIDLWELLRQGDEGRHYLRGDLAKAEGLEHVDELYSRVGQFIIRAIGWSNGLFSLCRNTWWRTIGLPMQIGQVRASNAKVECTGVSSSR